jgi:hypothetical protein
MRPRFVINFAAGLAMALAIWAAVAEGMAAHAKEQLLTLLKPGDDGTAIREAAAAHTSQLSFFVLLAALQLVIIFYTRRQNREHIG